MFRLFSFLALTLPLTPMTVQAQQYPDHPVKVIVGYAAGGGPDVQARTVAQQLSLGLGQQFFVENRLGANGTIATRSVVQSKPDGYTLLFSSNGIAPTPYIYKNLGYDTLHRPHADSDHRHSRRPVHAGRCEVALSKRCRNLSITRKTIALCTARRASATGCIWPPRFSARRLASRCSTFPTKAHRKS